MFIRKCLRSVFWSAWTTQVPNWTVNNRWVRVNYRPMKKWGGHSGEARLAQYDVYIKYCSGQSVSGGGTGSGCRQRKRCGAHGAEPGRAANSRQQLCWASVSEGGRHRFSQEAKKGSWLIAWMMRYWPGSTPLFVNGCSVLVGPLLHDTDHAESGSPIGLSKCKCAKFVPETCKC